MSQLHAARVLLYDRKVHVNNYHKTNNRFILLPLTAECSQICCCAKRYTYLGTCSESNYDFHVHRPPILQLFSQPKKHIHIHDYLSTAALLPRTVFNGGGGGLRVQPPREMLRRKCQEKPSGVYKMQETLGRPGPRWESLQRSPRPRS